MHQLEDRHQRLDRQGNHDHHEKARQIPPHARGATDLDVAQDLFFEDGLAQFERDQRHRQQAHSFKHDVETVAHHHVAAGGEAVPQLQPGHRHQARRTQHEERQDHEMTGTKQVAERFHQGRGGRWEAEHRVHRVVTARRLRQAGAPSSGALRHLLPRAGEGMYWKWCRG
ncbi:hypothetical protein XFF6990_330032 [Xanthomonas citri pv. fuscans]|nr:hypothetical protein XFF6990_330032 [Xanthomonas citri pv. fuscans]